MTTLTTNPYQGIKVAVLGDAMVDRFIYGEVNRISPEAPIPVVAVSGRTTMLGGAGNVAANLKSLDAQPLLIARLGNDIGGEAFREISTKMGISTEHLIQSKGWSSLKTRVIARTQQVVRFDEEETTAIDDDELNAAIESLKEVRKQTDVLVISDYNKGMITQEMLNAAKEIWADGTILVDPKPRHNISYAGVTGVKPNVAEMMDMMPEASKPKTDDEASSLAQKMCETLGLKHVLFTRSGDGMTLWSDDHVDHLRTVAKEVTDVSGAGDTVMATFAASIASGMSLKDSAHYANVAGGVVVEKLGTASITWDELSSELKNQEVADEAAA